MNEVTTIGIDLAKSVFQVDGIDASGQSRDPQVAETPPGPVVLQETAAVSGR